MVLLRFAVQRHGILMFKRRASGTYVDLLHRRLHAESLARRAHGGLVVAGHLADLDVGEAQLLQLAHAVDVDIRELAR